MADIKTHLRELSVATVLGLLKNNLRFQLEDLYNSLALSITGYRFGYP